MATTVSILLAGVETRTRVRVGSLTIHLGAVNTATLTIDGSAPSVGQSLRITVDSTLLFNGTLDTVALSYEGRPANSAWACTAIGDTARVNRRLPFGTWTSISATTIAQALITSFAPGFTSAGVEAGLPTVSVNFDGSEGFTGALAQLARLIGGYVYFEDLDLHLFQSEATALPDAIDSTAGRFLDDPPVTMSTDLSQLRTRVYGKGHGEPTLAAVAAGASVIPLANAGAWFNPAGGTAISETQRLAYTGVAVGGASSTVAGTAQSPGTPSASASSVVLDGHLIGTYGYRVAFVGPLGESEWSAAASATPSGVTDGSPGSWTATPGAAGNVDAGVHYYTMTLITAQGEAAFNAGTTGANCTPAGPSVVAMTSLPTSSDARVTGRRIYRTKAGVTSVTSTTVFLVATIDNVVTTWTDNVADANLGTTPPTVNQAGGGQITLSSIPTGPTGTTARRIYRTVAGGSVYGFLTTLSDNTTTTYVDKTNSGLGSDHPGAGSSLVGTPAGSTSLPLVSVTGFPTAGWADVGSALVSYTGVSGQTLTGLPASGDGALTATVAAHATVTAAPMLTGVTGLGVALVSGATVNVWVVRNDVAAQAAMAAIDGGDGIYEHLIRDERRGEASLIVLCDADLVLFSQPIMTVTYASRDLKTKVGKTVVINLSSPPISQTLVIQDVTITEIDVAPNTKPKFTVTASSVRFSLEDLLRRALAAAA